MRGRSHLRAWERLVVLGVVGPLAAVVTLVLANSSCGVGDPAAPSSMLTDGTNNVDAHDAVDDSALDPTDAGVGPPVRAPFGIDVRPSNTSCVAHARPIAPDSPVTFRKYYDDPSPDFDVQPMMMAMAPNDPSHFYLARRAGLLERFDVNTPQTRTTVANLSTLSGAPVGAGGEGGFLGFAFHPKFAQTGRVYVTWTGYDTPPPNFVRSHVGYITSNDGGLTFTSYTDLLSFDQAYATHFGGGIAFGRDGYLYVSFGDNAEAVHGQNKSFFWSKVLRIDVDTAPVGSKYGIPPDNPFADGGGEPATFAYGFRNPFRFSFDRQTGELWLGDVGEGQKEEVDRVERGGNYGWPCREGKNDYYYNQPTLCPPGAYANSIDPLVDHQHVPGVSPGRSITGGYVYRGKAIPSMVGTYVYGDYVTSEIFGLRFDPLTAEASSTVLETPAGAHWSAFAEDSEGEIYGLDLYTGDIYQMVPSPTDAGAATTFPPARLSETGCVLATAPTKPAPGLIPYDLNAPFWSDGLEKERYLGVPNGKTITVAPDGDFEFPNGSVLMKTFSVAKKKVETRLFMRHDDGSWAGYSYEWLDDQSDAVLLTSGKRKRVDGSDWYFPSRAECMRCHTERAGRTLGLEVGQLNRDFVYASTNRISNQVDTLEHIGLFATPLIFDSGVRPSLPSPLDSNQPPEARARAYLHANCAGCHRPPGEGRAQLDLRFGTSFKDTKTCDAVPLAGDQGALGATLITPGAVAKSLVSLRPHATGSSRMPPLASSMVDTKGLEVVDAWITSLTSCPQ